MIRILNFNVAFNDKSSLQELAAKRLNLAPQDIREVLIVRKAIDARRFHGAPIRFVYMLDVALEGNEKKVLARFKKDKNIQPAKAPIQEKLTVPPLAGVEKPPVVVGFGPAGMFAALTLARHGYRPLVLERGRDVDSRHRDIERFWQGGAFDEVSNVQFGEGGAGTFSDGKLTTRVNDPLMSQVLEDFVTAGAPPEIKYLHKPHIGTDLLRQVVKNIRLEIIRLGGEIRFESRVTGVRTGAAGEIQAVEVNNQDSIPASAVFMGIGHSARDTYEMLWERVWLWRLRPLPLGCVSSIPRNGLTGHNMGRMQEILCCLWLIMLLPIMTAVLVGELILSVCVLVARWWLLPRKIVA